MVEALKSNGKKITGIHIEPTSACNRGDGTRSHKDTLDSGCGSDGTSLSEYIRRVVLTRAGLAQNSCEWDWSQPTWLKFVVSGHLVTTGPFQDSQGFRLTIHQPMDGEGWIVGEVMRAGSDALMSSTINPSIPDEHEFLARSNMIT